ncbi:MAG: hypothetical protein EZS28_026656 [Streblomastix strix]|uniref:Uncharacterized protein n=1 Tax=Streblomastix strix TaxID=222440 RepID=A0A5J4V4X2_9EUKA|nr:MAG: hypothetical protein EZS28_026656 [Streblomastix strix]
MQQGEIEGKESLLPCKTVDNAASRGDFLNISIIMTLYSVEAINFGKVGQERQTKTATLSIPLPLLDCVSSPLK